MDNKNLVQSVVAGTLVVIGAVCMGAVGLSMWPFVLIGAVVGLIWGLLKK